MKDFMKLLVQVFFMFVILYSLMWGVAWWATTIHDRVKTTTPPVQYVMNIAERIKRW